MEIKKLENYLNELLKPELFEDYCPNGLQIEGKNQIKKILFSVSATKESADYAAEIKADALIVHHGLFWKFHGIKPITGTFYKRVSPLIKNDVNLLAYHLPLDGHMEVGNAATLGEKIGLSEMESFGNHKGVGTGIKGVFKKPVKAVLLKKFLEEILEHSVIYSAPENIKEIKTVGIITGGANSQWIKAAELGLDAYITGEMSEHDYHESREAGIHMFAGGHHATEKFGIQNLMKKISSEFKDIECVFLDSKNPA